MPAKIKTMARITIAFDKSCGWLLEFDELDWLVEVGVGVGVELVFATGLSDPSLLPSVWMKLVVAIAPNSCCSLAVDADAVATTTAAGVVTFISIAELTLPALSTAET